MSRSQSRVQTLLWMAALVTIVGLGTNFEILRRLRERDFREAEDVLQRARGKGVPLLSAEEIAALESDPRLPPLRQAAKNIEPLHETKRPPDTGDWLAKYQEAGQTFDQYLRSNPNRLDDVRTRFYIQPMGQFTDTQRDVVDETAELLSCFYNLPVKVLDSLTLDLVPAEARRTHPSWGDKQLLTTYILDNILKPRLPDDAAAMLALTTDDLWPGENNFVFGQASRTDRVGVWSIYRYGDANDPKPENPFRRRLFKVAIHETGHMFGIAHCIAYECCMNGVNSLDELDNCPMWFCPQCVQKVWWACSADRAGRYQRLAEFAAKHELVKEAEFWAGSRDRVD